MSPGTPGLGKDTCPGTPSVPAPQPRPRPEREAVTDLHPMAVEADSPGRSPGTHLVCVAELGHLVSMVKGLQEDSRVRLLSTREEPSPGGWGQSRAQSSPARPESSTYPLSPLQPPRRSSPVAWGQMRSSLIWADHPPHTPLGCPLSLMWNPQGFVPSVPVASCTRPSLASLDTHLLQTPHHSPPPTFPSQLPGCPRAPGPPNISV